MLAVDVGGSHVKALVQGESEPRCADSLPRMTPRQNPVHAGHVVSDPVNLGKGWVGFDYAGELEAPTRIVNDAAMQALGSYERGTMLFLGLGTGLGSALVAAGFVQHMELGHLPYRKGTYEDYVNEAALERLGKKRWPTQVADVVATLAAAVEPD